MSVPETPSKLESLEKSGGYIAWTFGATAMGLASDLARPVGNFAPLLFALSAVVAVITYRLSRRPRSARRTKDLFHFSLVGSVVFLLIWVPEFFTGRNSAVPPRGVLATNVGAIGRLQTAILPLDSSVKAIYRLDDQLKNPNQPERYAAVRDALKTKDDAFRREVLEIVMRSGDPRLRQIAILRIMAIRTGQQMPILATTSSGESDLTRSLIGATMYLTRVDEAGSGFTGGLRAGSDFMLNGTVATDKVVIATSSPLTRGKDRMTMELTLNNEFQLVGPARTSSGQSATVTIPLF
jgi:hypothetical protein